MDTSPVQQSEKDVSLIVHVDDTQSDLEADITASETNNEEMNNEEMNNEEMNNEEMNNEEMNNEEMNTTLNEETEDKIETEKTAEETTEEKAKDETEQTTKKKGRAKSKRELAKLNVDKPRNYRWNLRITGLVSNTCLDELKKLCSQYGTVLGGKILSKKRKSGIQYRASIGMSKPEEAEKCIKFLNQTKVEGHKIKIQKKRWRNNSLWRKLEISQKQEEALRLFQFGEKLRWEKMKIQNQNLSKYEIGRQLLELNFRWTEVLRLNEMRSAMEKSNDQRSAHMRKFPDGSMGPQMNYSQIPSIFQLPFQNQSRLEEMNHSMKRPQDQSYLDGSTRSKRKKNKKNTSNIPSIFELPYQKQPWLQEMFGPLGLMRNSPMFALLQLLLRNQPCVNEYKNPDFGKQVQRNERSVKVPEGGSQLDNREEKQMQRPKTYPFPDVQKEVERQIEGKLQQLRELVHSMQGPLNQRMRQEGEIWNEPRRPNMGNYNNAPGFNAPFQNEPRMGFDARRDMGRNRKPERRYAGSNQEQGSDSRNIPSGNRMGQMRSPAGGGSKQKSWDSGNGGRKANNWSRPYGDNGNSNMNQPNDQWFGNPIDSTGRDATGAFVDSTRTTNSKGTGYNKRSTNSEGGGYNQRPANSEGMGYNQRPASTEGMGYNQRPASTEGMGYNQRPANSEWMGYNQRPTNSEGMGYNQRPANSEGMGYNQRYTNNEGMGYNQSYTNNEGVGYNQRYTNSEGMGYNQKHTNMFDNSQSQDGIGGYNGSGQMQQPYFNAYNTGY